MGLHVTCGVALTRWFVVLFWMICWFRVCYWVRAGVLLIVGGGFGLLCLWHFGLGFRLGLRLWCGFVGLCLGRWLFVVGVLVVVVCFCFRGGFVLIVLFLFTF